MKIYASNVDLSFDPNGDERFATELDQFVGKNIWVHVTYSYHNRDHDAWVRLIKKGYNGNVLWIFNKINFKDDYHIEPANIPELLLESKRVNSIEYRRLHPVKPIELATMEDLIDEYNLYDKTIETEQYLDSIIGQDKWAHVAVFLDMDGEICYCHAYAKILQRIGDEYIFTFVCDGDVDNPDDQYTDYTRSGIKDLISTTRRNPISNFGLLDDTTKTTHEIEVALDKPWLED